MARGTSRFGRLAAAGCLLAVGCTQTSRVDDNLSTASLGQARRAVAVMRVGAASPSCINVAVLLGVREGDGYRRHQGITVANVRSITEPAVAEVELDPGEYHVLAYRCQNAKATSRRWTTMPAASSTAPATRASRCSRARSSTSAICISSPGVTAATRSAGRWRWTSRSRTGRWSSSTVSRPSARTIYAQMTTRLMKVVPPGPGAPGPQECARLKALRAEGKVQQLPAECQAPASAGRKAGAVAKSGGLCKP